MPVGSGGIGTGGVHMQMRTLIMAALGIALVVMGVMIAMSIVDILYNIKAMYPFRWIHIWSI